ncbi:MAG: hypothetical protein ACYTGN_17320 [Planctomycetota bacterium]
MAPYHPIELMLEFLRHVDGPLVALYLLIENTGGRPPGRYQSPVPVSRRALRRFCERFADFLERDSRHAFWILDNRSEQRLIFDRHDLVFAYGRLDDFEKVLVARGYTPGEAKGLPIDHRPLDRWLDQEEDRLMDWWPWIPAALYAGDEGASDRRCMQFR